MRANATTILQASAKATAASCEDQCKFSWIGDGTAGDNDVGAYLNALEVFLANLPARPILRANDTTTTGSTTSGSNESTTNSNSSSYTGSASGFGASTLLALGGMLAMVFV